MLRIAAALAIAASSLAGCSDVAVVGSETLPRFTTGTEWPYFESEADVPSEYLPAKVFDFWLNHNPRHREYTARAGLDYFGNLGEVTFHLQALGDHQVVDTRVFQERPGWGGIPWRSLLHPTYTMLLPRGCGYTINMTASGKAAMIVQMGAWGGTTEVSVDVAVPRHLGHQQPMCPTACSGESDPFKFVYDPQDSGDDCQQGPGGEGSGIQYSPGEYTNGETVNWHTGVGNGGVSVCGTLAKVEWVCVDVWNGSEWQEKSCGYATTC